MNSRIWIRICWLYLTIAAASGITFGRDTRNFCAYFVEWGVYDRNYVVADIPAEELTCINYAFIEPADIDSDSLYECRLIDTWAALEKPMSRLVPGTDPGQNEHLGNLNQFRVIRRNHPESETDDVSRWMDVVGSFPDNRLDIAPAIAFRRVLRAVHGSVRIRRD